MQLDSNIASINNDTTYRMKCTWLMNYSSDINNLDNLISSGAHQGWYICNSSTIGTPCYYGLTSWSSALVLSFSINSNGKSGLQLALTPGEQKIFYRMRKNSTTYDWAEV